MLINKNDISIAGDTKHNHAPDAPKQWQNLDEFMSDPHFAAIMRKEFPREAAILEKSGMDRRNFLKLMGASLMLGGIGLTGCAPRNVDHERIQPYVEMPEEIIPGIPLQFATTMTMGGYGVGVLLEAHEGRPHRTDSNPNHPGSAGGSNAMLLASILELYNPMRSTSVRDASGNRRSWDDFVEAFDNEVDLGDGSGLRILTEQTSSPTLARQVAALQEQYPEARWYQYEPVARNNVVEGARIAFGDPVETTYNFDEAAVIVSLDADFLMGMPGSLHYAKDYAAGRRVRNADDASMNRHYAVESTPTNTGAVADHRLTLRAGDVENFALALANALGVDVGNADVSGDWDETWFNTLVEDLQAADSSLVVAGDQQTPLVHALAHAINGTLGNVGSTVVYTEPVLNNPGNAFEDLSAFVSDMASGEMDAVFILGGNPAYNAPVNIPVADAIAAVPFSVHVSLYYDQTSENCTWHIPATHYIEEWSDARAFDGTGSVVQPPIGALYDDARSAHQMIAFLAGDDRDVYDIVRETWQELYDGDEPFDVFFRRSLHDGVMAGTAPDSSSPSLTGDLAQQVSDLASGGAGDGLEVIFRPDPALWDGRFSNNPWLQELPDALTKITWDNVGWLNAATAERLGVSNGDLVDLQYGGRTMQVPVWIVSHQPVDSITVSLGYGNGISAELDAGLSFDAYTLRTSQNPWFGTGAALSSTGQVYKIAQTQKQFDSFGTEPAKAGTLATFLDNPDFAKKEYVEASFIQDDTWEYEGYAWGMSIDLTSCIGCNACMVGCQSENNIPTVGKSEVLQERDMHWIRVDLYEENGRSKFQPVPCQHCENAPCEYVCPVQATVHDHEGLNQMIYNRCVGTRFCSANCPYSVRRFNFFDYIQDDPILVEQRNPDVTVRMRGVMEKCTYCWQRINQARVNSSKDNRAIADGEIQVACQTACPTDAISFGDINNAEAAVSQEKASPLTYSLLGELNTKPRTTYLAALNNPNPALQDSSSDTDED